MGCVPSSEKASKAVELKPTNSYSKAEEEEVQHAEQLRFRHSNFVTHKSTSIQKEYTISKRIGSGAFGIVQRAVHKSSGHERAIKSVRKVHITNDMKEQARFFNEIDILRQTDHPNIVRMYEFFEDKHHYHIVTELLPGGELFDFIIQNKLLSEPIAAHFLKQILSAVSYCHTNGIVHRDIKPENLLLDSNSPNAMLKVIDFGTSALFDPSQKLHQRYGTAYYIAPEVLKKEYDSKCDIWSCGVILYILLSGVPPFHGSSDEDILLKVRRGKYSMKGEDWDRVSSEAKNLISRMLDMDPERRPTALEALHDRWFSRASLTPAVGSEMMQQSLDNLKKFHADEKLQQAVMAFITSQLISKEDTKQLTQTFNSLDLNGDGKLSKQELIAGYSAIMNPSEALDEVERIMKEVDTDANGFIEYSEFVTATLKKENLLSKDNLEAAFAMFDRDGSGTISAVELRDILGEDKRTTDNVWHELINQVDLNGDGEIDIKEFKEMMLKHF